MRNRCYFCIDIGGTKTAYAVYSESGEELFYGLFPTFPERGIYDLSERIYTATADVLSKYAPNIVCGVIASPGPLDIPNGKIVDIVTMGWKDIPIVSLFETKFGFRFLLLNDCNAGALGVYERYAKDKNSVVYISVSTGIGGGIVLNGTLYNGKGNAAEIGHLPVPGNGIQCGCGKIDCLELYASGTGIERRYLDLTGKKLSCADIANNARKGELKALTVFENMGNKVMFALRSVVSVLDPETIVFGGSVCKAADLFFPTIQRQFPDLSVIFADESGKQVVFGAYVYGKNFKNDL